MSRMLSGPEMGEFHKGLMASFDVDLLTTIVDFRLDQNIGDFYGQSDDKGTIFRKVIREANQAGWWPDLLIAAVDSRPNNGVLQASYYKILDQTREAPGNLEKVVSLRSNFENADEYYGRIGQLMGAVCAIENSRQGLGTGWLVGEDLVFTNFHVIKQYLNANASRDDLRCRFDFRVVGGSKYSGRPVGLAKDWCVAHQPYSNSDIVAGGSDWQSHELDYALLRLNEPVGTQPSGQKAEPGAPARGWITVSSEPVSVETGDPIFVWQHPLDLSDPERRRLEPLKYSDGKVLDWAGDGMRLRYDARTLPGSSGSVCCNGQQQVIALHHAGDPNDWPDYHGEYNQAIPIGRIVADLVSRLADKDIDLEPFWDVNPPT